MSRQFVERAITIDILIATFIQSHMSGLSVIGGSASAAVFFTFHRELASERAS